MWCLQWRDLELLRLSQPRGVVAFLGLWLGVLKAVLCTCKCNKQAFSRA